MIRTCSIALALAVTTAACQVNPMSDGPIVNWLPVNSQSLTLWRSSTQPKPGTIVRIFASSNNVARATVESDYIAERIPARPGAAFDTSISITDKAGVDAAAKFVGGLAPSADAKLARSRSLTLTTGGTTVSEILPMQDYLGALQTMDSKPKANSAGADLFQALGRQSYLPSGNEASALFIVTKVFSAKSVQWKGSTTSEASAGIKCELATATCGSISLNNSAGGTGESIYKGDSMVVYVELKRIGREGDVLRILRDSAGPKVIGGS